MCSCSATLITVFHWCIPFSSNLRSANIVPCETISETISASNSVRETPAMWVRIKMKRSHSGWNVQQESSDGAKKRRRKKRESFNLIGLHTDRERWDNGSANWFPVSAFCTVRMNTNKILCARIICVSDSAISPAIITIAVNINTNGIAHTDAI